MLTHTPMGCIMIADKIKNKGSEYMKCEKCSKCESCEKSTHRTEEEKKSLTKRLKHNRRSNKGDENK